MIRTALTLLTTETPAARRQGRNVLVEAAISHAKASPDTEFPHLPAILGLATHASRHVSLSGLLTLADITPKPIRLREEQIMLVVSITSSASDHIVLHAARILVESLVEAKHVSSETLRAMLNDIAEDSHNEWIRRVAARHNFDL